MAEQTIRPRRGDLESATEPRARVRRFCEPCAADARVMFGSDLTAERPLENADRRCEALTLVPVGQANAGYLTGGVCGKPLPCPDHPESADQEATS